MSLTLEKDILLVKSDDENCEKSLDQWLLKNDPYPVYYVLYTVQWMGSVTLYKQLHHWVSFGKHTCGHKIIL